MRRSVTPPGIADAACDVADLAGRAATFSAPERGEALIRKWLVELRIATLTDDRQVAIAADAVILAGDLLLSLPSSSGSTAFDRLANSPSVPRGSLAMAALRGARFRLMRLEASDDHGNGDLRDVVSGERLRLIDAELPPLPPGTPLFGRVAMLDAGYACRTGALTPLDDSGFDVARAHPLAAIGTVSAATRWAQAVYAHVVRHGTLDVPGLNRPSLQDADPFDGADDELMGLARAWSSLDGAKPDADMLLQTRHLANCGAVLGALNGVSIARRAGQADLAYGFERMLHVMIDTLHCRQTCLAGTMTLDELAGAIDRNIAARTMSPELRPFFDALRLRATGGTSVRGVDAPALATIMQRIQGLRAKTVEQGCTEHEALAAAEKVAELLDRYGLSLSETELVEQVCDGITVQTSRRRLAPVDDCLPAIAAFFDCRVWAEHRKGAGLRYIFFGMRADVAAAEYLHDLVERAFETETAAFRAGPIYAAMAGERRSASNSFQIGLGQGIRAKLANIRATRDIHRRSVSGRDLVPLKAARVDEEMERLGLSLRTRGRAGGKRVLSDAYDAGEEAGQRFEFAPAISQAA